MIEELIGGLLFESSLSEKTVSESSDDEWKTTTKKAGSCDAMSSVSIHTYYDHCEYII
jgi:hypothetical protein